MQSYLKHIFYWLLDRRSLQPVIPMNIGITAILYSLFLLSFSQEKLEKLDKKSNLSIVKKYQINIYNNQKTIPLRINKRTLTGTLADILKKENQPSMILNFIFVDNGEIRRLNRKYLGRNRNTDVIAFGLKDK
ncbi:MAG: rRNA maturation RNAse YbeY, partial [Planctomycetota bacterium]|nr:rRNA maturation RNAse YbeY [Planctomycetota bacterium]